MEVFECSHSERGGLFKTEDAAEPKSYFTILEGVENPQWLGYIITLNAILL